MMMKSFDYKNTPNVDVVNEILVDIVKMGASEANIKQTEEGMRIDFKINDEVVHYTTINDLPRKYDHAPNLIIRLKIMADLNIVETNEKQDGEIKAEINGVVIDQKVIITPTENGEEVLIINK